MASRTGGKGRKAGRQSRFGGMTQSISAYRQRRMAGVAKGGNNGAWRGGSTKPQRGFAESLSTRREQ